MALTAVLGGGLLLAWPAWVNGFPILAGETPAWPAAALWAAVLAQAGIVSHLVWLLARSLGRASPRGHALVCAALAIGTTAPWFASLAAPDIWAAVTLLGAALLGWAWHGLSRAERLWLAALTAGAAALAPAGLVLLGGAVLLALAMGGRGAWRLGATLALASILVAAGPGVASPELAVAEEEASALRALHRFAKQLVAVGLGDTLGRVPEAGAGAEASLQQQLRLRLAAEPVAWLHPLLLLLAAPIALLNLARAYTQRDGQRLGLLLAILLGLVLNAAAHAGEEPRPRQQARIAWLLPLAAALIRLPPRPGVTVAGYATESPPRGEVSTENLRPDPKL